MKHIPFADKPTKSAYMWRDIERRAAMYGIPLKLPVPYPAKQSVVANLVAIVGMRENWGADFVRAAYRRWFQRGEETGSEPNVSESLRDIGQDPERARTGEFRGNESHADRRNGRRSRTWYLRVTDIHRRSRAILGRRPAR